MSKFYCRLCAKRDVDHLEKECSKRCTLVLKGQERCGGLHTTYDHKSLILSYGYEKICPDRCPVIGCVRLHYHTIYHECFVCKKVGIDHVEKDCPDNCTIPGCKGYHTTANHSTHQHIFIPPFVCKEVGPNHINDDCPEKCTTLRYYFCREETYPDRCPVIGCTNLHSVSEHKCFVCKKVGVTHSDEDCPDKCTIPGCQDYHVTNKHTCSVCDKIGIDHIEKDCPDKCTIPGCNSRETC